jgi:predicted alpha/beta hydrolase
MFSRQTVTFPVEGGIELSAWLYLPNDAGGNLPAITMAHGFGLTKYHCIAPMAEALAQVGFAVLLHDHRGFGDSQGPVRQDINPWEQIADWRRAISYLQDRQRSMRTASAFGAPVLPAATLWYSVQPTGA